MNSLSRLGEASRENDPSFAEQCGWEKYREHLVMAQMQDEQGGGTPSMAEGKSEAEVKLILYHWTHSFSSQKVKASAGGGRRGLGFSTRTAPSRPGPHWPTWKQASKALTPPKLPPGQGCALVGVRSISLRWKGYAPGAATHGTRPKASFSVFGLEALFPGPRRVR